MPTDPKPAPPLEPSTSEHGVWGYDSRPVGGFGESYDGQVAHGAESDVASADPGDDALCQLVRKTLAHAHVDAANLRVVVRAGAVSLYGTVHSEAERSQLEARARSVPGVVSVQSGLLTEGGSAP